MRMTTLFSQTLRELPADAEIPSHKFLVKAGYIRQLSAGIYTAMPLARRSLTKIENIIRREMDAIGGQEITMPVIHPAELWQETGRWQKIGSEMGRFKDKNDRDMVLAMTHEEVVADLTRKEIHSYRQLPVMIYHIQTKWRDDPRPRGGLVRVREFTMKDSYTLDRDWEGLEKQYQNHYQAYQKIFHQAAIPVIAVKSDVGMMGGKTAHEFMYHTPNGEDSIVMCDNCGYAANRQIAIFKKEQVPEETPLELIKVSTPGTKTIAELSTFLEIPEEKTAKAVFMVATFFEKEQTIQKFVFAILRGDMELSETKLSNTLGSIELRPALEDEILAIGAVPGYASPIGIQKSNKSMDFVVVVDELIPKSQNLVAGANDIGFHFINVNYGRDYEADIIADITSACEGDRCDHCNNPLAIKRGVEVGNIFQLGTHYSESMGCYYQDSDGKSKPVVMGSYGIGSGRLLACIVEEHHDDFGIIWPVTVAPYHVHLVMLPGKSDAGSVVETANRIYQELWLNDIEVLFDDRPESPGVKFNDADLIGIPLRVTISARNLEEGLVEVKRRDESKSQKKLISLDNIVDWIIKEMDQLKYEIEQRKI